MGDHDIIQGRNDEITGIESPEFRGTSSGRHNKYDLILNKLIYFFFFSTVAFSDPYFANYLLERLKIDSDKTAIIFGISPFFGLVTCPLVTFLTDRIGHHKVVLGFCLVLRIAVYECFQIVDHFHHADNSTKFLSTSAPTSSSVDATFWATLVIIVSLTALGTPSQALIDSFTFKVLGSELAQNYGRQRMWGTFGFMIFSAVAGFGMNNLGPISNSFWLRIHLSAAFTIPVIICIVLLKIPSSDEEPISPPLLNDSIAEDFSSETRTETSNEVLAITLSSNQQLLILLRNWRVLTFLFVILISGGVSSYLACYQELYLETVLHASQEQMGLAIATGTLAEFVMFQFSGAFNLKFGNNFCLILSLFASFARFNAYFFIKYAWVVLPIELLNSLTFALSWATLTSYANIIAPAGHGATLQGLVLAVYSGGGQSIACFTGGILNGAIGIRDTFLVFAYISFFSGVFYGVITLCQNEEEQQESENYPKTSDDE